MIWTIWECHGPSTRGFYTFRDEGGREPRILGVFSLSTLKKRDFSTQILLKTLKLDIFFPEPSNMPISGHSLMIISVFHSLSSSHPPLPTFPYAKVNCTCSLCALQHPHPSLPSTCCSIFSFYFRYASLHQVSSAECHGLLRGGGKKKIKSSSLTSWSLGLRLVIAAQRGHLHPLVMSYSLPE